MVTVLLLLCSPVQAGWSYLGDLSSYEETANAVELRGDQSLARIESFAEGVVRIRVAPFGEFARDFSWAVLDLKASGVIENLKESETDIQFNAGGMQVVAQRSPCRITIKDAKGNVLLSQESDRGIGWNAKSDHADGQAPVRVWHEFPDGTSVYGLGEKAGVLNKENQSWCMWNSDTYAYTANTDPMYMSVPFYVSDRNGVYHGVFFDNPWRSSFDFGKTDRNVASFGAEGGELTYYVIAGPEVKTVLQRYTKLTGRMELPPKWAIGYHQCRYSYFPEPRVREIVRNFKDKKIPCDVIWFDINYMDGYRCFTWDKTYFPDPGRMTGWLKQQGFHTIAILDPGIKTDPKYHVYHQGTKAGVWVKKADGDTYKGKVWPGEVVFPDFTNPGVREWWSDLFPPFLEDCGLDGVWNDMNEPSDFVGPNGTLPLDVVHNNEGLQATHLACHNIYGMQMARATLEGIRRTRPEKRAFTLTRASYAGGQRFGAAWTGDNLSSWEHLKMSIPMVLNMGISGMPFVGPDIGGFVKGATPELFARWIQVGALYPFSRTHTGSGNPDQEPWSYGREVEQIARVALTRRYCWMPYFYTLFEEASRTGVPVWRPLWMEGYHGPRWFENQAFMIGSDILVVPTLRPETADYRVPLPQGVWYNGNTGNIEGGGRDVEVDGALDVLPHFIRAGAIIPTQSAVMNTGEVADEPLIIDVWPYGESEGELYEDDGESLEFKKGVYRRTRFNCKVADDVITLVMLQPEGEYKPSPRTPLIKLHGVSGDIQRVLVASYADRPKITTGNVADSERMAEKPGSFYYDSEQKAWLIRMNPDEGYTQEVRIELSPIADRGDEPVVFEFDKKADEFAGHVAVSKPIYKDGVAKMIIREVWPPLVELPRLSLNAEDLPVLKVKMAVEHASKMKIRFASELAPADIGGEELCIDCIADGEFHEYTVDMANADSKWTGTIYWVEFSFPQGTRAGETIRFDRVSFEPR